MKKLVLLTVIITAIFSIYVKAEAKYDTVTVNYMNNGDKSYNVIYNNGRIYMPLFDICNDFGIDYKADKDKYILTKDNKLTTISASTNGSNKTDMYFEKNTPYVYLYKVVEPFNTIPVVDIKNNKIDIFKSIEGTTLKHKTGSVSPKSAYIRLEDITADGLDNSLIPNYNANMLEELRYTAQYLYECGQSYYISWIPVYANPKAKYWNDVSKDYNLYNSYFVYTLDYMMEHNGHLGLHGFTHQYGNDISGVGYEWGKDTPYSVGEQENRMKKAIECADRLGYKPEFFEFPHYGATAEQIKMASKYFDFIYQGYPSKQFENTFTYTAVTGKKVYFMPTPADYVHTKYDVNNMINRLSSSINNNYTLSLFYHPVIDSSFINEDTKGYNRVWNYGEGVLPKIQQYVSDNGYRFTPICK